ncbi:MAG: putative peptidoglycan glycosyltransferase FtsW [Candidatus Hydrogenedentota bacterium]
MRRESIALLSIIMALVFVGIYSVYSALAVQPYGEERILRHYQMLGVGLMLLYMGTRVDYHILKNRIVFRAIVCTSIALLILVLIPGIGVELNGARRWIELGGFRFQPSEMAKFALILLLAVKLSTNQEEIGTLNKGYLPAMIIMIVFAALTLLENDLGTPVVLCVTAFFMFFVAGIRWYYLAPSLIPAAAAVWVLIKTSEYRAGKITAFLDPWGNASDTGFQLIQSMTAFVKGGVWGMGAGAGEQKLNYIPESDTDFILTVWAEEMGMVATLLLAGLFTAFLLLAVRIANRAPDLFGTLLASGIAGLISFQAAFNMAVTIGLLPTKGLPLPFISRGGTSLMVFMAMAGVLINIGLQAEPAKRKMVQPVSQT